MKWRPKNDTCGVPGKGFIKARDYSQEDEDNLIARAKRRKIDPYMFMLNNGFEKIVSQVDLFEDDTVHPDPVPPPPPSIPPNPSGDPDEKPKRNRRTKAEMGK